MFSRKQKDPKVRLVCITLEYYLMREPNLKNLFGLATQTGTWAPWETALPAFILIELLKLILLENSPLRALGPFMISPEHFIGQGFLPLENSRFISSNIRLALVGARFQFRFTSRYSRKSWLVLKLLPDLTSWEFFPPAVQICFMSSLIGINRACLLYTSDAADE